MDEIPKTFNIQTAARDFGKHGRTIEIDWADRVPGFAERRMRITVNGWTISCVWGSGNYCTGAREAATLSPDYVESIDAEVAAWPEGGRMIDLGDDSVAGWVSPKAVIEALAAAERNSKRGIREALTSRR